MTAQKIGYYVDLGGKKNKRESVDTYRERQFTLVAWIFGIVSLCNMGILYLAFRIYCIKEAPRKNKKYVDDTATGCCGGKCD